MRKFYNIYQYIAFLVIFPFSLFIWYKELHSVKFTLLIASIPLITAYIVPAIGTNVTKLWKFNTKYRMGNFRLYHGFVFGSVQNLFGFMMYKISPVYSGIMEAIFFALITGAFIAFWNWFYDIYAVKSGFMIVNNKPAYEKKSAYEIVTAYAPVYFYMFGLVYGIWLKVFQHYSLYRYEAFYIVAVLMLVLSLTLPTFVYACFSRLICGDWGIAQYKGGDK